MEEIAMETAFLVQDHWAGMTMVDPDILEMMGNI